MSLDFTTEPRLTYDQVLASRSLVAEAPGRLVYADGRRHAFLRARSGSPAGRLTLLEEGGHAAFERFGGQEAALLVLVAEEHGVQVLDEHGLRYPEESDG